VVPKAPLQQTCRDDPGDMTGHERLDRPQDIETTGKFEYNILKVPKVFVKVNRFTNSLSFCIFFQVARKNFAVMKGIQECLNRHQKNKV
jgi:hypothetical protein